MAPIHIIRSPQKVLLFSTSIIDTTVLFLMPRILGFFTTDFICILVDKLMTLARTANECDAQQRLLQDTAAVLADLILCL